MATITKIPAAELREGDTIGQSKKGLESERGNRAKSVRAANTAMVVELEGAGKIKPRKDTKIWVALADDDDRLAGAASPDEADIPDDPTQLPGGERASEKAMRLADEEMERRKATTEALKDRRGIALDTAELDDEQFERARRTAAGDREGLTGRALKTYILTGSSGAQEARETREANTGRHTPRGPKEGSMTSAMLQVMKPLRTPATARDVTKKILERNLAPGLKGKTPEATVGAKLSTEAAKPNGLFERVEPGKYKVRAGATS